MWFRNLRFYCLTKPFEYYVEGLEEALSDQPFRPCNNYEKSTMGWVAPVQDDITEAADPPYTQVIEGYIMLCAKKQERLLPASVVREAANDKIVEIQFRSKLIVPVVIRLRSHNQRGPHDVTNILLHVLAIRGKIRALATITVVSARIV